MAVVFGISAPIIKKNLEVGNIDRAQREARHLAFEMLHDDHFQKLRLGSYKMPSTEGERSIASLQKQDSWSGEVGSDPWGRPYKFRFLRNEKGMPVQLAVWSQGPEIISQEINREEMVEVIKVDGQEQLKLHPDVVVTQVPLR